MIGCEHNAARTIVYPRRVKRKDMYKDTISFHDGQNIQLVCPKGCEPLHVLVTAEGGERDL